MGAFPILFLGPALLLWLAKFGPIIAIVYTLLWIGYSLTLHPLAKVPGPFWASVTRLWYVYHVYKGDMDKVQRALHEEYGPVIRIAPNEVTSASVADIPRIYRLSDPLLKTDFYPIWGAPQISKQPDQFTCIDENEHTRYRKIVGPIYSLANILKHEKVIGDCTNIFLQRMNEYADKRQAVDIGHWLHMYAFDVVGELCFGRMFGFMENNSDINGWIGALDALMPVMCAAAIAPTYVRPFIMGSAIVFPSIRRALKSFETISNAAVTCVNRRVKEIEAGTADRLDLLQQFSKIVRDKGTKVNFTDSEVTLEGYAAM